MQDGMEGAIHVPNKRSTSTAVRRKMREVCREVKRLQNELLDLVEHEESLHDNIKVYISCSNEETAIQVHGQNPKYRYTGHVGGYLELKMKG